MGEIMKKYFKYWPVFVLIIIIIINLIHTRPRTVEQLIKTSSDTIYVKVTDWIRSTPRYKKGELTEEEFNEVIEMMSNYKYRKTWGAKINRSDTGSYYFITFDYFSCESNEFQTVTLSKNGGIQINNCGYDVSSSTDISKEIFLSIYEYICEILDEK